MTTKYPGIRHLGRDPETKKHRYQIRATYRDPSTGKQKEAERTVIVASAKEALAARESLRDELMHAPVELITVGSYAKSWLMQRSAEQGEDGRPLRAGTLEGYARHLANFCEALGHVPLRELTPLQIKEWLRREAKRKTTRRTNRTSKDGTISGYTIMGALRVVRTMLRDASVDLNLPKSPAEFVRCPKPLDDYDDQEPNALTAEEWVKLWDTMRETEPDMFPLFAFMSDTGTRWCHAHAFEWSDLDLDRGTWRINRSRYRKEINPPSKRKSGHHAGALTAELVAVLREQRAKQDDGQKLVFPNTIGGYIDHRTFSKALANAAKAAGITKRITPHGCRRTMTTHAAELSGEAMAMKIAGHSTAAMTRHYMAPDIEAKRGVVEQVAARRNAARARLLGVPLGVPDGTMAN